MAQPTTIRVGQRLLRWDGVRGYVALNSLGKLFYGPGETFKVVWQDAGGDEEEPLSLDEFEAEGVQWGKGRMPWAR